ncbi:adenylate/guanylate cyclase domain-containing protein [Mesoterricola silvestris]|uniref:Adenylate/guanylate cyclase domain-containing protein n=1 Tax=Mesoterricola silvestris TaxID=2927979 RepID=A0AA48K7V1_9BACT|nr:adenylate/guanylate cyclase domain-containing protein [Mesoterricola silvestris]BDU72289.1 adenylate/guanylate cyclase domain-containing protein [Mesoterricola silvestris]
MRRYSLKVAISTLVSGLILLSAASVATALYFGTREALYLTTRQAMGRMTRSVSDKLESRLAGAERLNLLLASLIRSGNLDPAREEAFTDFLADALAANPSLTVIDVGLPSGNKYQARTMDDGTLSRRLVHRSARDVLSTWHHANHAYAKEFPDTRADLETGYDPRERPWYKAALAAGRNTWTEVYGSRAGLNYSNVNPVYDAKGRLLCVTAIDLNVAGLSTFLEGLRVGRTGRAFIVDDAGHVVAMPLGPGHDLGRIIKSVPRGDRMEYSLREIGDLADAGIREAVLARRAAPQMKGWDFLAFRDPSGRRMLASFRPEPGHHFTVGVVVPEEEILGTIKHSLRITAGITLAFVALSLVLAYAISRAIARPLGDLVGAVDRIRLLDLGDPPRIPTSILEVVQIDRAIANMRNGLRSFKKYVPSDVVLDLIRLGREAVIEGEKRELTFFFSDIQDFTSISERVEPEELVAKLGAYFEAVSRVLIEHGGTVDKFIGDSVMGFWNAPKPLPDHALRACTSALRAQARIAELNAAWKGVAFHTRIGLHTGEAIVGNIGYDARMNYTAIGDNVNLASRLEGLNKVYGTRILISGATAAAAGDAILTRPLDRVSVKGKRNSGLILELVALRAEATPDQIAGAERFAEAFDRYQARDLTGALALLEEPARAGDGPAQVLAERCRHYLGAPPGDDWNGVFEHHAK